MGKAKSAKRGSARKARATAARPKAKAKPKPRPKAKAKAARPKAKRKATAAKGKAKAMQKTVQEMVAATPASSQTPPAAAPPEAPHKATPGMEPFLLAETSPGKFSLLLTTFDAAEPAFALIGVDGGGYAWEGVAKHVVAKAPVLGDRIQFDPEASMFCAYSEDRAGLEDLGKRLSALYNDLSRLTKVVTVIGPSGFDD